MNSKISKHWVVVAALCGMAAASLGLCVNCSGVFFTPVAEALGIKRGSFAMTATISTFLSAISAFFLPKILTRSNFKKLVATGTAMAVLSTVLMAFAEKLWQFYLLAAVRGIGIGFFAMVTITLVINHWFVAKHGLATSVTMSFSGICGALGSPIFTALINNAGYKTAYIVMGIANLLMCLPAILIPFELDPADEGLKPYSDGSEKTVKKSTGSSDSVVFTVNSAIILMIMAFLGSSLTSFTQHLPSVSAEFGFSSSVGALMLSFALVGNITSKLLIGMISDRFGAHTAYVSVMSINLLAILLLITVHVPGVALFASLLFGFVYASAGVGMALLTRANVGNERYGSIYPIVNIFGSTGAALALSIVGYIYDFTGSYRPALYMVAAVNITSVLLAFVLKKKGKR